MFSISDFTSLVGTSIGITSYAIGFKICATTVRIKKCKSIIMKKRKNNKIVLLAKTMLNTVEVLMSKA